MKFNSVPQRRRLKRERDKEIIFQFIFQKEEEKCVPKIHLLSENFLRAYSKSQTSAEEETKLNFA